MKDINRIYDECVEILENAGIEVTAPRPTLKVNSRATKRWGQSKIVHNTGYREIQIAKVMLDDNANEFPVHNTMLHEMLHQECPGDGHGGEWKRKADKLTRLTVYNITRCTNYDGYGVHLPTRERSAKYICRCKECGLEIKRERMSRFVAYPEIYKHGTCTAGFERIK